MFGDDINICHNCNTKPLSFGCLSNSYKTLANQKKPVKPKDYLGGSEYYLVEEVEVYLAKDFKVMKMDIVSRMERHWEHRNKKK